MRKTVVCVLMLGALVGYCAVEGQVRAQADKKDKDTKKVEKEKDTKKAPKGGTGTIEIGEGKDGKFRFTVRNSDGKLLAMSGPTGYATKKDAQTAIEDLKEVISKAKVGDKKMEPTDK